MNRRIFLTTGLAFATLASLIGAASAQGAAYPSQPIRMIVPFAAGGGVDAYARLLAQQIREKHNAEIVVENRAGSNGTVGGLGVARAEPNGYVILFSASTHVMAKQVMQSPPYDPLTAFTPIARVGEAPLLLVMNPQRPQKNISEVVADAKLDPAKWDFAVSALGSMGHLATIGFGHLGGLNLTVVPYRGTAPGLTDVSGGHVQLMLDPVIALLPLAQSGGVKPLAITTAKRSRLAPEIPTAAEAGMPGLEFSSWYGVWGPPGTPKEIVAWLNKVMGEAVNDLTASGRLDSLGIEPVRETPEEFAAFIEKDVKRNAELLEIAKFKPM